MTARNDYPLLAFFAGEGWTPGQPHTSEVCAAVLDEIDRLRDERTALTDMVDSRDGEVDELRLLVSTLTDELGRCENEHVVRDETGKPLNLRESYDALVTTAAAEHQRLVEDIVQERHLGQLMFFAQQRWQSMAEDLWEYIQEWHIDSCSMHWVNGAGMHPECSCHRILATKWDELTHADDWADFADEAEAEALPDNPEFDVDGDGS